MNTVIIINPDHAAFLELTLSHWSLSVDSTQISRASTDLTKQYPRFLILECDSAEQGPAGFVVATREGQTLHLNPASVVAVLSYGKGKAPAGFVPPEAVGG